MFLILKDFFSENQRISNYLFNKQNKKNQINALNLVKNSNVILTMVHNLYIVMFQGVVKNRFLIFLKISWTTKYIFLFCKSKGKIYKCLWLPYNSKHRYNAVISNIVLVMISKISKYWISTCTNTIFQFEICMQFLLKSMTSPFLHAQCSSKIYLYRTPTF